MGPEDQFLAQAGEVHHCQGGRGRELDGEIPVGNGVHAVLRHRPQSQLAGEKRPVERNRRAGKGAASHGQHGDAGEEVPDSFAVALEHFKVGEEVV